MGDRGHNRHGPITGGCCAAFVEGAGSRLTQCGLGQRLDFCTKWRLHPSSRLASIDMNRKLGACAPFKEGGGLRPHLTQRRLAEVYLCTKWHLDPSSRLATIYNNHNHFMALCPGLPG